MSDNPDRVSVNDFLDACWRNEMGPIRRYVSDQGDDIHATNGFGYTGLHRAAMNGHVEVCRFLVENGADTGKRTRWGRTALDIARLEVRSSGFSCSPLSRKPWLLQQPAVTISVTRQTWWLSRRRSRSKPTAQRP